MWVTRPTFTCLRNGSRYELFGVARPHPPINSPGLFAGGGGGGDGSK